MLKGNKYANLFSMFDNGAGNKSPMGLAIFTHQ